MREQEKVKIMSRKASDNKYLHKDFHQSMNLLLTYVYNNFGKKKLIQYLMQYAEAYYKPLNEEMKSGEIEVLEKYFIDIYKKEEWPVEIEKDNNCLTIVQNACPGITQIKSMGGIPCPHYRETYDTVYTTLCTNTPFEYTLEHFNDETGACKQIFKRKGSAK